MYVIGLHKGKKYTAREVKSLINKALKQSRNDVVLVDWYTEDFSKSKGY